MIPHQNSLCIVPLYVHSVKISVNVSPSLRALRCTWVSRVWAVLIILERLKPKSSSLNRWSKF